MILVELEIENYKQYAGNHRIAPPPDGVVGVIGANGVGKTTLFEAIEWCLYKPSEVRNEEVPPRGGTGATRVKVVLEDPRDGVRYVVERRLRRGVAAAEVYRADQPEAPLVQGPRQVSDYVARHLIGLGHRAFVSTFFTRQKELSFFGDLRETERRREVGRLLGLETIRDAQQQIRDTRNRARAEALSLAAHHADLIANRDLPTEAAEAAALVVAAQAAAEAAEARQVTAHAASVAARGELDRWQALEREDNVLWRDVERLQGDERAAAERRAGAAAALARLDESERTRATLAPLAETEPAVRDAVAAQEAARERHLQRQRLQTDLNRIERSRTETATKLERTARQVPADPAIVPGWGWTATDGRDPIAAADRLLAVVDLLDVDAAHETAAALGRCQTLVVARTETDAKWRRYDAALRKLAAQRAELVASGEPRDQANIAQMQRERALRQAQEAETRAQAAAALRKRYEPLVASLQAERFEDVCPTCARPFTPAQAELTLSALLDQIDDLDRDVADLSRQADAAHDQAKAQERAYRTAVDRARTLNELDGRIGDGQGKVEEAKHEAAAAATRCADSLAHNGLRADPTEAQVTAAQTRADLLGRVAATAPVLRHLRETAGHLREDAAGTTEALATLGDVTYDEAMHRAAQEALTRARDAVAAIRQIDRELAARPELDAHRAAAAAEMERLASEIEALRRQRATLGFDAARLAEALGIERSARDADRVALETRNETRMALRDATRKHDDLLAEHLKIAQLAERADAQTREASLLDQFDREFTNFDQYVANRVTPQLAEQTSELLSAVTEGKYDRVEFDENYGLEVYDGIEHFPLAEFSGGERDAIALCARLALSRLIGGQAAHPPGFLVLDEVFGSLDRERRMQVLETLGTLAGTTDAFRQMFIISHVDDVRSSPILTEVWRVVETADGVSQIEYVTQASGLEEL